MRVITLNRPDRLNALDGPMLESLEAAVLDCAAPGHDIRVLVIRGVLWVAQKEDNRRNRGSLPANTVRVPAIAGSRIGI